MPVRKASSLAPNKLCKLCNSAIDAYMAGEQTTALSSEVACSKLATWLAPDKPWKTALDHCQ